MSDGASISLRPVARDGDDTRPNRVMDEKRRRLLGAMSTLKGRLERASRGAATGRQALAGAFPFTANRSLRLSSLPMPGPVDCLREFVENVCLVSDAIMHLTSALGSSMSWPVTKIDARAGLDAGSGELARGQQLQIIPVAGTGAYHSNPISGGCLFGKNRVTGECNFNEKPKYGYNTIISLPPPKGPPDANGFRALPPVKFPKALLSVAGEEDRKNGDSEWRVKVAMAMKDNDKKLTELYKILQKSKLLLKKHEEQLKLAKQLAAGEEIKVDDSIKVPPTQTPSHFPFPPASSVVSYPNLRTSFSPRG